MLEINRKITMMRGGDYHLGEKRAYLCSASVCFWVFAIPARTKKRGKRGAPEKKGGNEWTGPPNDYSNVLAGFYP
jgi:hypothetical protein